MVKRHKETGRESARENPPPTHTHTMMRTAGMSGPGPGPRAGSRLKAKVPLPLHPWWWWWWWQVPADSWLSRLRAHSSISRPTKSVTVLPAESSSLLPRETLSLKHYRKHTPGTVEVLRQSSTYNNNTRTWNESLQKSTALINFTYYFTTRDYNRRLIRICLEC